MTTVHAVTPIHVPPDEIVRRQARYDALAPAGVTVRVADVGPDAPTALESEQDIRASEEAVVAAMLDAPPADYYLPDCVLDPGVARLRQTLPVVGILQLSLGAHALLGHRLSLVARNPAITAELDRVARSYGWGGNVCGSAVLGLSVDAIDDPDQWLPALGDVVGSLPGDWVINGCSAVDVPDQIAGRRIVDPTAVALQVIGLAVAR